MRVILYFFLLVSFSAQAQALRDINYKYLYSPEEAFRFDMEIVRQPTEWTALYRLAVKDTTATPEGFLIHWEIRESLGAKEGTLIQTDSVFDNTTDPNLLTGKVMVKTSSSLQVLAAKVVNKTLKQAWFFYKVLEPKYPVTGYVTQDNAPVIDPYVKVNTSARVVSDKPNIISYYRNDFPPATPAFSESVGKVSTILNVDSTFIIPANDILRFSTQGLYLIQHDTLAAEGFTIRAEDDYPRLTKLESLADPLIYICTRQEFERIKQAKGDKRTFDKVILNVTGDAGRAKIFMRSYFRRVEVANQLFTSYKEGWKTDRGMIYIIFGLPDEVFKFSDREVWNYKTNYKITFEFTKSPTLFDPENFVLIRQKKYQRTWYEVIDLWRNARF